MRCADGFCHTKVLIKARKASQQNDRPSVKHFIQIVAVSAALTMAGSASSFAQHAQYDAMVATHAQANGVPEALVHRVIRRESGYNPRAIHRGRPYLRYRRTLGVRIPRLRAH